MKRILMLIMAVAVAVAFSAPSFAGDPPKETKKGDKKGGSVVIYAEEKKDEKKKDEKKKDEKK